MNAPGEIAQYRYIEDDSVSDIGFEAWADSLSGLFRAAWDAALSLMIDDPGVLREIDRKEIGCENPDLEMLLVDLLGELLYLKDAEHSLYRVKSLSIETADGGHRAVGVVVGEPIDPRRHKLGIDLKAVTLDQLRIWHDDDRYRARVSLDV